MLALKSKYPDPLLAHTGETGTEQLISRLAAQHGIPQEVIGYLDKPYASASTLDQPEPAAPALARPYFPDTGKRLSSVPEVRLDGSLAQANPDLARAVRELRLEGEQEAAAAGDRLERYSETYLNKVDQLFQAPAFGVVALDDSRASRCVLGRAAQFGYHVWKPYEAGREAAGSAVAAAPADEREP